MNKTHSSTLPAYIECTNPRISKFVIRYDIALQTGGQTLPVTFKLGTDDAPIYHTFTTIDALTDFIRQMHTHIRTVIEAGWHKKDTIDLTLYHTI